MPDPRPSFAVLDDLRTRYPRELVTLGADEETGLLDEDRVVAVLGDVSAEIRAILYARYSRADLDRLDDDSRDVLRVFAMAMALYQVALSFSRSTERLEKGYSNAVARLKDIAAGKGALVLLGDAAGEVPPEPGSAGVGNGTVLVEAAERLFTRERMRGL